MDTQLLATEPQPQAPPRRPVGPTYCRLDLETELRRLEAQILTSA